MKILELCLSPDLGGLELYVSHCVVALRQDHTVHALLNPSGSLIQQFQKQGLDWDELSSGARSFPLFRARQLARYIDTHAIEAIHVHWGRDLPLAALAKWMSRSRPRLIYTRHMDITRSKKDLYHRFVYQQVDVQIVTTKIMERAVRKFMSDTVANRVTTLYMGVSPPGQMLSQEDVAIRRQAFGLDKQSFLIGLIGRVKYEKGQHLLVKAIHELRNSGCFVTGLIVGRVLDEMYLDELEKIIARDGLQGKVKIMSFVDNPQTVMQLCDVVVLTSYKETFGLVLVEAMRSGVAVIGPNSGGAAEIIEEGKTGLVFEAGDATALAESIRQLYEDTGYRKQLAEHGKQQADEQFNEQHHFARLEKLLTGSLD